MQLNPSRLSRCASIVAVAACLLFFFGSRWAEAAPLDLTTNSPGDVTTFAIDVSYTASSGTLVADSSGDGQLYSVIDDNGYFYPADFEISATVNPTTGALVSGTVELSGAEYYTVDGSPFVAGGDDVTLIEGNLIAFGFPDPTNSTNVPLEFEFQVTGGALTAPGEPYYNALTGGIELHMISSTPFFTGNWPASDFSGSTDSSYSDTFPMTYAPTPEPSTFLLLMVGVLPFAWRLRRRGSQPV